MNFRLSAHLRTGQELALLLRQMIHSGELEEGEKLPTQRDLADQIGVSRVVIREALAELTATGYVYTRRGAYGGTFVAELGANSELWKGRVRESLQEFDDLCEFRIAIESHAAWLAASRRTPEQLASMRRSVAALTPRIGKREFRVHDTAFHFTIAEASASPRIEREVRVSRGEFFMPVDHVNFRPSSTVTKRAHADILTAIENRDGPAAARLMSEHIQTSRDELHSVVSRH